MDILFYREERGNDSFRKQFESEGYCVGFAPILRTEFLVPEAPPHTTDAVVVTSWRAMEALEHNMELQNRVREAAGDAPWYGVGSATRLEIGRKGFCLQQNDAACAADLMNSVIASGAKSVLFLAGDPHRPALENGLREAGVTVQTYVIYRTTAMAVPPLPMSESPRWIVLFSPRGAGVVADTGRVPAHTRIAAIGNTTARAARETGLPVTAVASRPEPASLIEAIRQSDKVLLRNI